MDQYAIPVIILGPPECRSEGTGRVESMKSTVSGWYDEKFHLVTYKL